MSTITAPQGLVWAFNPYYVEITDSNEELVKIVIGDYSIDVSLYNGSARAYVSRMIQMLFDNPMRGGARGVNGTISIRTQEDYVLEETEIFAIWGSVEQGEHLPGVTAYVENEKNWMESTVQYFVHFPFTLDLIMLRGMTYMTRMGVQSYGEPVTAETTEIKTLVGGEDIPTEINKRWVFRQDVAAEGGPFDDTFDYTFHLPADSTVITKVVPRYEREGYYLRWIDRFGFMRYYLFDKGDKTYKTNLSEYKKADERSYGGMYYNGHNRHIGVTTEVSMKICASNMNQETLAMVETVVSAPVIDLYIGKTKDGMVLWQPVSVEGGSYVRSARSEHHSPLQDLEITILLPNRFTQTL